MKKGAKRHDGTWEFIREMRKDAETGECIMGTEPVELPDSPSEGWGEFNKTIKPMYDRNKKRPMVCYCVKDSPFHKCIKKLRKQRRKK